MAAGAAEGINIWNIYAEERELIPSDTFLPTSTENGIFNFKINSLNKLISSGKESHFVQIQFKPDAS